MPVFNILIIPVYTEYSCIDHWYESKYLVLFLQHRRCINPKINRAGETPPVYELHIYYPFPGHHAHHCTAGNLCFICLLFFFLTSQTLRSKSGKNKKNNEVNIFLSQFIVPLFVVLFKEKEINLDLSSLTCLCFWRQNESCFRQDFLLKYKNRTEQDEIETRENLNRLLLENVLPAHVAALFVSENKKNEVHLHQGGSGAFKWSQTFFSPFNDFA